MEINYALKNIYGDGYQKVEDSRGINKSKKYAVSGKYDGKSLTLFNNNIKTTSGPIEGKIKYPDNGTKLALGINPSGSNASGNYFNGTIYSVRIYNRALTDEEIMRNYQLDKARFNITEE